VEVLAQQDPIVSQYMHLPVLFNAASAGSTEKVNVGLVFRRQWASMKNAPQVEAFTGDMPFHYGSMGLGVNVLQESVVAENKLTMQLVYAYKINLGKGKISFGMNIGAIHYRFDASQIAIKDPDDKLLTMGAHTSTKPDLGFGFYYSSSKWNLGISANHLLSHNLGYFDASVSQSSIRKQWYGYAKRHFKLNEKWDFDPSLLIRMLQPLSLGQIETNAMLVFKEELWLALGYRSQQAATFQVGFKVGKINQSIHDIRLSYSYDAYFSEGANLFGPTHEIVLRLLFDKPRKASSIEKKSKAISPLDL
jgi:type IX secretion system PorP/SprF family membrane protein